MSSSDLGVSCDKLCLVIRVVVHKRTILTKVGCNMSCGYGAPGQNSEEEKKKKRDKHSILAEESANIIICSCNKLNSFVYSCDHIIDKSVTCCLVHCIIALHL